MDYKLFCDINLYVPSQYVRQSFLKPVLSCLAESWTQRSQQPCSPRLVQLPCHLLTLADFPEKSVSEALSGGALCSCPKRSSEISLQDLGILWKITATKMEDTEWWSPPASWVLPTSLIFFCPQLQMKSMRTYMFSSQLPIIWRGKKGNRC